MDGDNGLKINKFMNATDLRIAFKIDTGNDALWAQTHNGKDVEGTSLLRGYPRSIYGRWLENNLGDSRYLRNRSEEHTSELQSH